MKHSPPTPHASPFLRSGLAHAIPMWILFRQSLHQAQWKSKAQTLPSRYPMANDADLIQHWLTELGQHSVATPYSNWAVIGLGALFGFLSMVAGLNYSGSAPVNLWLLLGLYCFVPLLMTMTTSYAWFNASNTMANTPSLVPKQYAWAHRLYSPLLNTLSPDNKHGLSPNLATTDKYLLRRWFMWKLQGAALTFQLSAIVAFVLVLLFKDVAFGWSSTIIQTDTWIPSFIENLARPWSWLIAAPSAELIENSRFYRAQNSFDAAMLGQWWSYVLMAMIVYGFLPRLLLANWMKFQLKRDLLGEISTNGDTTLFIRAAQHVNMPHAQTNAKTKTNSKTINNEGSEQPSPEKPIDLSQYHLIAWQFVAENLESEIVLGKENWEHDTEWIHAHAPNWQRPLVILVSLDQTPTAELADLVVLISELTALEHIGIVISVEKKIKNARELGQLNSWRAFAYKHKLALNILNSNTMHIADGQGTQA